MCWTQSFGSTCGRGIILKYRGRKHVIPDQILETNELGRSPNMPTNGIKAYLDSIDVLDFGIKLLY